MRIFSLGGNSANRDPMVDIERLLTEYAWTELADTNCFDRLFKQRRYALEVNFSYLDISHRLSSFHLRKYDTGSQTGLQTGSKPGSPTRGSSVLEKLKSKVLQRDLCLFRTEFTNSSDEPQTFTFKTERKTTSRCDVNIQKGFRIGANIDVRVSVPTSPAAAAGIQQPGGSEIDSCRITGGLSGELHVTKATGQTIEEVLTWGVDSQVKVEKKSRVVATLMIREEEMTADFTINSVIRATHGVIPVYVKCKKTGQLLEMLEILSENLSEILPESEGFVRIDNNAVRCETKGTMRAVYGSEQIIRIDPSVDVSSNNGSEQIRIDPSVDVPNNNGPIVCEVE